jgi:hypothetical protein
MSNNQKVTRAIVMADVPLTPQMGTERIVLVNADGTPWSPEVGAGTVTGDEVLLTGMTAGTNTPVAASDNVNQAIAKLQAQIDALP